RRATSSGLPRRKFTCSPSRKRTLARFSSSGTRLQTRARLAAKSCAGAMPAGSSSWEKMGSVRPACCMSDLPAEACDDQPPGELLAAMLKVDAGDEEPRPAVFQHLQEAQDVLLIDEEGHFLAHHHPAVAAADARPRGIAHDHAGLAGGAAQGAGHF